MTNSPTSDWDSRDASVLHDQRRAYDEMRERCPVAYDDFLSWSLFRHQDIVSVLADPKTYSSASTFHAVPNGMDPPEHDRYVRIIKPYFRPEEMSALEPRCRSIADELCETLLGRDEVEFMTEFAQPLAFKTLCTFLGWSPETWQYLRNWTHDNQAQAFSRDKDAGATLAREFTSYATETFETRRKEGVDGNDDIITQLLKSTIDEQPISDKDLVSMLRNWTASAATVAAGLGIVLAYLAAHADLQQDLRQHPELIAPAIEEILRMDGPLVANRRTATCEVEIEGKRIAAGETLTLNWIAANRDGRTFDHADTVRMGRDPSESLVFGAGIHHCLGAPMARLEIRVAIEELLVHTTAFELCIMEKSEREIYPSNGFKTLAVRFH